ncbi:sensor domain-containing diguanylate cyclase [Orrella sp. JC864]|uniref:sensor domain-containing diguanylate cyclase n=1 Tax=Orrella sp. JC864 TaxID=3120298 RepID=UPI00300ADF7B
MPSRARLLRVDLRRLILWLCMLSVLLAVLISFYAGYLVQRDVLLRNTLESNRVYAAKLASVTNHLLADAQHLLAYSVDMLQGRMDDAGRLGAEAMRLQQQSQHFDSVVFIDAHARVLAVSPPNTALANRELNSPYAAQVLAERRPSISQPYQGTTGRWLVGISYPIFGEDQAYLGAVIGTLFLHERNVLYRLLGQHYYRDGSQLYVVDRKGVILYHPDPERIGQPTGRDAIAQDAASGMEGERQAPDADGTAMLAGFAWINNASWGVVAQRPTASTIEHAGKLLWDTVGITLPLLSVLLLSIWWLSKLIARPLWQLAGIAQDMEQRDTSARIGQVKSWYFEAAHLKKALIAGLAAVHDTLQSLRQESATDPLTGLANRRGLALSMQGYLQSQQCYAVMAIDIDFFKRVNDTYGHDVGDRVLQHVAQVIRKNCRDSDLPCRIGGEEFLVVLPRASLDDARRAAQRLHEALAAAPTPTGETLTVSIGLAHYPDTSGHGEALLKHADAALYQAKRAGRNRTEVASPATQA